jgi:hypothetical protein
VRASDVLADITIGAAGTGVSGATGSDGHDTVFKLAASGGTGTFDFLTHGGQGGLTPAVSTAFAQYGGAGGSITSSGGTALWNRLGNSGGIALFSASVGKSGEGGRAPLGTPGDAITANASSKQAGGDACNYTSYGYGSGGGGSVSADSATGSAQTGGSGCPGVVIARQYAW